jgi:WD40 repeat protein
MQTFDIPPDDAGTLPALAFGPDGRFLAVDTRKRGLLLDTAEGRWLPSMPIRHARFVLGGQALAYIGSGVGLSVMDLTTGEHRSRVPPTWGQALVAAPDGQSVSLLSNKDSDGATEIQCYDVTTLACRNTVARHHDDPSAMAGSADGRKLATGDPGAEGKPVRVWDVVAGEGAEAAAVVPKGKLRGFALSADGSRLGTVSTRGVTLWDAATGAEVFSSGKHRREVKAVCFHSTRPLAATGDGSGNVFLWDFAGRVLTRYDWGLLTVYSLAFAPDGLRCAAANAFRVVIWDVDV